MRPLTGLALGVAALAAPSGARAHQPPPRDPAYPALRPTLEASSWIGAGGGAVVGPAPSVAVFDLRLGGDFTASIGRKGDTRLGPFAEVTSASFAGLGAVGGVELFFGAIPRPLRMFYYPGEGVLAVRLGAGWAWRQQDLPGSRSAPIASVTVAYGYRAPFSLREFSEQTSPDPEHRAQARYMTGVRLWAGATVDLDASAWQVTGGLEFEPVGAVRYLLGLY